MPSGPVVGLDIGTQQIKVVEVRPSKGGLAVSALGLAPTPVGVMQNNIVTDPRLMGQAIKQLLRESGITAKRVVGSVAGQSAVVIRIIEVPKMNESELKETMKWEVERHVPFAPSETMIDYQPLTPYGPDDEANPNMEVLLAVAQQDIVNNLIDTSYASGLDPIAIDIEPLATGRGLLDMVNGQPIVRKPYFLNTAEAPFENSQHETVAIVNIGASNTDISIYQDGQLAFPRSLPLAGDSLTRAIAEMMGYTLDQAERIKRDYASVQLERMAIYTGTAYGDDPNYEAPQFRDDDVNFGFSRDSGRISGRSSGRISGRSGRVSGRFGTFDDAPLTNPFDMSSESDPATDSARLRAGATESARLRGGATESARLRGTGNELNLAQPGESGSPLDLAQPGEMGSPLDLAKPGEVNEMDRTQPISRRTLNLARNPEEEDPNAFLATSPFDLEQGFLGGGESDTEVRDQVFEAIAPIMGELATELRRSLDYYRSRAQGRSVDRVVLAGGSANLHNIDLFLQNELQVPVQIADPFSGMTVSTKHYDPDYLRSIASAFSVAFGLAAREAVFNANPAEKKPRRSLARKPKGEQNLTNVPMS